MKTGLHLLQSIGKLTLGIAISAGALLAGSESFAQAPRTMIMKTAVPSIGNAVPLVLTMNGYDKAHGITVEMNAGGSSSNITIDAVLAGDALIGFPGTPAALQAIRSGAPLKIIGAAANNQLVFVISNEKMKALGISPDAPIADRMKALKGMTIGGGPFGSTYRQILIGYLQQYGLDPEKDVRLVGVNEPSAFISGLQNGTFDIIANASGVVEQAIALGFGSLWASAARGDIPGSDKAMVVAVIVRADTIEKRKADVDAFRLALADALNAVNNNHAATGKALKDTFFQKTDPKMWDLAWGYAIKAFPASTTFTKEIFDYWVQNDPQGAASYKDVDYKKIVYEPAQSK